MAIADLTIIGESINDSVPSTKKLFDANDIAGLLDLAKSQDEGGASWIDVNVGLRPAEFMARMRERTAAIIIFVTLVAAYAFVFPRWLDWNQNSRFDLTAAIVEHGTLSIDEYVHNTGDYAVFGEHAFSDKMPGLSFLAVPVYTVIRPFTHLDFIQNLFVSTRHIEAVTTTLNRPPDQISPDEFQFAANLYLTVLIVVALPSALLGVILFSFLGQLGYSAAVRALAVIAYGLATPAFSYSGTFYSHQFTATALFAAFAWIHAFRARRPRTIELLLLGALLGIIVITEVPAVFIVALLGLYAIWTLRRATPIALMIIGGLPPLIITALYHWSIFGTPFTLAYLHHVRLDWREQFQTGLLSASFLRWGNIWGLTFSSYRGLFFSAPILLLSIPGFWLIARRANWRAEWLVSLSSSIGLLLIFGLSADWNGGYSAGPRYLIPMIPFMVWPLAATLDRIEHEFALWRSAKMQEVLATIERRRPTLLFGLSIGSGVGWTTGLRQDMKATDAVKRRVWATTGRCQGFYCTAALLQIMARETGLPLDALTKRGPGSELLASAGRQPA